MPIPRTRAELVDLITTTYGKLAADLEDVDQETAELPCTEDWSIKDLLAVRARWTEMVLEWIEAGRRGEDLPRPAPGYTWRETPRLNNDIVKTARDQSYRKICGRLERGVQCVFATIELLSDDQLLTVGQFGWADKWPIARWISINTATQYASARTMIRRAKRSRTT
jgi:hypothetical protein